MVAMESRSAGLFLERARTLWAISSALFLARGSFAYGPAGLSEFRTDLPLDECFDRLDEHRDADEFVYECRREKDGGFLLHLTLHQPTQQPLDTLYTLRLDPGRQTVVTLIFIREAFGYKEPLFPQEMLDRFMQQKLDAHRTK